jgi:hypothetical protein
MPKDIRIYHKGLGRLGYPIVMVIEGEAQVQHAPLGGADAGEAQSCPDFPVALTVEWAVA